MVHVTSQSRYGAINTYKANTYGFNRVFRAILAVLEELSDTYECSPEGALALIRPHLTLGELEVVDEPMDIDIRHDEEGLKRYLQKAHLGRQGFLLQVVDLLVRLQTRDGYDALSQIELAAIHARGALQLTRAVSEKPSGSEKHRWCRKTKVLRPNEPLGHEKLQPAPMTRISLSPCRRKQNLQNVQPNQEAKLPKRKIPMVKMTSVNC